MVYIDIFVSKIQFMYLVFGRFSFLSVSVFNFPQLSLLLSLLPSLLPSLLLSILYH